VSRLGTCLIAGLLLSLCASCLKDEIEDRFAAGLELLYENHYEDAESHFLLLARQMERSNQPGAHRWQAKALMQAGLIDHLYLDQPRRALARLREALKVDPEAPFAFEARREIAGIFYDRLMDYRSAAQEYERLVHEYPQEKGIDGFQYRVAQSYFLVRDFDQARTEARMLLEKWPDARYAPEALLLIANSYYLENRFAEAIEAHRKLLDMGPDVPIRARSLFELGMCYQDLGDKAKAEESFLAALKDHPRPDLVQMQLKALRERIDEEDSGAKPLSYATASQDHGGPSNASSNPHEKSPAPKPEPKPAPHQAKASDKHEDKPAGKSSKPASKTTTPTADPKPAPKEAKPVPKDSKPVPKEVKPAPEKAKPAPKAGQGASAAADSGG